MDGMTLHEKAARLTELKVLKEMADALTELTAVHMAARTVICALFATHPNPRAVLDSQMHLMDAIADTGNTRALSAARELRDQLIAALNGQKEGGS